MDTLLQDLKFGLKLLWKEKGFTITTLLTLALCIGANSTIFSMINTVLLRPLPYEDSGEIVAVFNSYPGAGAPIAGSASGDYFIRSDNIEAFGELALYQNWGNTVGESGSPEFVSSLRFTPSLFPLLRVEPLIGRNFLEEEMDPGNEFKVILSYGFWQERFAGDENVLGEDLRIDGNSFTIIGVMPEDFYFFRGSDNRFFVPIPIPEEARGLESLHDNSYQMIGRMASGATIEQALAQIEALDVRLTEQLPIPNAVEIIANTGYHVQIHNLQRFMVRDFKTTLLMLWTGVFFVLLIGCVNIANLMLARSNVRAGELATRFALGAGRTRLTRMLISESVLLAVLGGVLGLGVASLGMKLLAVLGANQLPRGAQISLDFSAMLYTLLLSVGAGLVFGAIPLINIFKFDLSTLFRQEGRTTTASRRAVLVRNTLVVAQIAIAFTLLIGAGLMFYSFRSVLRVDPGFNPDSVLTGYISLPPSYDTGESICLFYDRLLADIRTLPGVSAAGATSSLPFSNNYSSSVIIPEGYELQPGESVLSPFRAYCTPGYFDAMGIPLLEGRTFEETDTRESEQAVIIDEWLARRYWPDSSPIGKRMIRGVPGMEDEEENLFTVIGVVGQIKQNELTESEHSGAYYHTYRQRTSSFMVLAIRTAVEPASLTSTVREAVTRLDPELPVFMIDTMEGRISDSMMQFRTPMLLLVLFAGVALFLAAVGIYGVLSYSVTQRSRELGIRIALGSGSARVFRSVVIQGVVVLIIGLAIGIVATLWLVTLIEALLFGVEPTDPFIFGTISAVLALVVIIACAVPARRATRIDPVATLNYE